MSIDDLAVEKENELKIRNADPFDGVIKRPTEDGKPETWMVMYNANTGAVERGDISVPTYSCVDVTVEYVDGEKHYTVQEETLVSNLALGDRNFGEKPGDQRIKRTVALLNGEDVPEMKKCFPLPPRTFTGDLRSPLGGLYSIVMPKWLQSYDRKHSSLATLISHPPADQYRSPVDPHQEIRIDRTAFEKLIAEYEAGKIKK